MKLSLTVPLTILADKIDDCRLVIPLYMCFIRPKVRFIELTTLKNLRRCTGRSTGQFASESPGRRVTRCATTSSSRSELNKQRKRMRSPVRLVTENRALMERKETSSFRQIRSSEALYRLESRREQVYDQERNEIRGTGDDEDRQIRMHVLQDQSDGGGD